MGKKVGRGRPPPSPSPFPPRSTESVLLELKISRTAQSAFQPESSVVRVGCPLRFFVLSSYLKVPFRWYHPLWGSIVCYCCCCFRFGGEFRWTGASDVSHTAPFVKMAEAQ